MRRLLPFVALAFLLGPLSAAPALADDIPPPVFPSGLPGPEDVPGGGEVETTPGPTYVVTPSSEGTTLPEAPTQAQVDDARQALDRAATRQEPARADVAAPAAVTASPDPGPDWWLIGSGVFLGLILIEARRVTARVTRDVASR